MLCSSAMTSISRTRDLAVCILLCERMLPALVVFSKEMDFDCSDYLNGLASAWSGLRNVPVDQRLSERCSRNAPDTEHYSHPYTSYALNCALAIAETMQFALDGNSDHIESLRMLAKDSVFLYRSVSEHSDRAALEDADSEIYDDLLLRDELRRQKDDQLFVLELPEIFDADTVQLIRERSKSQSPLLPMMT